MAIGSKSLITNVVVGGAGMAGLALGCAIKQALQNGIDVTVFDPSLANPKRTNRTSAVAAGPRHMLDALGVWDQLSENAQPIHNMVITDSDVTDRIRPSFLNFAMPKGEDPYAHMVFNSDVEAVLRQQALKLGVELVAEPVIGFEDATTAVRVQTSTRSLSCALLVAADGARSSIRTLANIGSVGWDYPLSGIVATIGHTRAHNGIAYEHFLPDGPFAILPLTDNRCSIVWTLETKAAQALLAQPRAAFLVELKQRFGHQFGEIVLLDEPYSWPLSLQLAKHMIKGRVVLVGDAAHSVHPLAGQGINLGFRDIAALAEGIVAHVRLGLDSGSAIVTSEYERTRRFDSVSAALTFDGLSRLFEAKNTNIKKFRDLGLGLVDRLPELKSQLIREASGSSGNMPLLFTGQPL